MKYIRLPQDMTEFVRNDEIIKTLPDYESNLIGRIETERDKVNAEGEMYYSKSEIEVFNKCIKMVRGEKI